MTTYYKYPKIPHLPNSPGISEDDIILDVYDNFKGKKVIISEKMDGENTNFYKDHYHARSIDSRHHPSRSMVKSFWGGIRYNIPKGWRIIGENLYATHSIHYTDLDSYFYGFSIWDNKNFCIGWDKTLKFFDNIGIRGVTGFYAGEFDLDEIMDRFNDYKLFRESDGHEVEGFVIRLYDGFEYENFGNSIAKYVRKGHVQTDEHWMHKEVVPNKLK